MRRGRKLREYAERANLEYRRRRMERARTVLGLLVLSWGMGRGSQGIIRQQARKHRIPFWCVEHLLYENHMARQRGLIQERSDTCRPS
jgi:hypothetical protein